MRTEKVIVEKYDPMWKEDLAKICDELMPSLKGLILAAEHVGSTAVEGMSAKPIIDIDLVISDERMLEPVIHALESIGYHHEGDLGIEGREAFRYDGKEHLRIHHLYVCSQDSLELKRHLGFRDYLRSHPEAVLEYSIIKEEAAKLFPDDIEKYMEYKSSVIERLYHAAGILDL